MGLIRALTEFLLDWLLDRFIQSPLSPDYRMAPEREGVEIWGEGDEPTICLRECKVESDEYRELVALRFNELRRPLGLVWEEGELARDHGERHFGLYLGATLIGVAVVGKVGDGVKIRQVAVQSNRQDEGYGRSLMGQVESLLWREGVMEFRLHARVSVAGFYDKLGYVREGEIFEEVGVDHVLMVKRLT